MIQTPIDVIDAMSELLKTPATWVKGQAAINALGQDVLPHDPGAQCFCVLGALSRTSARIVPSYRRVEVDQAVSDLLEELAIQRGFAAGPAAFNDDPNTKFEDVRVFLSDAREVLHSSALSLAL